jgi:DNA polymerase elongation subunit (family B)
MKDFYINIRQVGDNMLVKAVEKGKRVIYKDKAKPFLFIRSQNPNAEYKTIHGEPADRMDFDSIREARDFAKRYEDVSNFDIFGMTNFLYPYINEKFPGEIEYDRSLINIVSLDIETMADSFPNVETADKELTAIAISNGTEITFLSIKEYKKHQANVRPIRCANEEELIYKFIDVWKEYDPDIITGWNIEGFDIPYLINRIKRVVGTKAAEKLSPWGIIRDKKLIGMNGNESPGYDIFGVEVMDYMLVYKKWTWTTQESYKLDHIAEIELGQGKVSYEEYGSLHNLYLQNFQLYSEYNVKDTEIIDQLEKKMKLMELALAIAYDSKLNYEDAFTSVRLWDVIIHNYLMDRKIVVPQSKYDGAAFEIPGGYVKEPQLGKHKYVCSLDLNSLYPSLIRQYNISPEKYVGKIEMTDNIDELLESVFVENSEKGAKLLSYLKKNDYAYTPNSCVWLRDSQGFLAALMEKMYNDRKVYKKKMIESQTKYQETKDEKYDIQAMVYHNNQMSKKLILNSAFGAYGNSYFRFFNADYASAITTSGQLVIRYAAKKLNALMNQLSGTKDEDYIIAIDTDSLMIKLDAMVAKKFGDQVDTHAAIDFMNDICSKILEPKLEKIYADLAVRMNAFENTMVMKREALADSGIWIAKKRYVLNVYDNEGVRYTEPKLKMMGIEAVRSSTPAIIRDAIKNSLKLIMNGTESDLISFIENFRREFYTLPYEKVSFPRGLNGMTKYKDSKSIYKSGCPIHVRGALLYNKLLVDLKLNNLYDILHDGDKIKFCYLKTPNRLHENVISTSGTIPKELEFINTHIDYDTQFTKGFLSPLANITDTIGWKLESSNSIEDFFA